MNHTGNENLKQDRNNEITRKRLVAGGFQVIQTQLIQPNTVLIDDRVMWYGSLAPFGYSRDNDNIMRVESPVLVTEMKSMLTGSK
jgi:hypothetical protein